MAQRFVTQLWETLGGAFAYFLFRLKGLPACLVDDSHPAAAPSKVPGNAPTVSVIIVARSDQQEVHAIAAAKALRYADDKLEILVSRGDHPSHQRNVAAQSAAGDWLYLLDDDSLPDELNLERVAPYLRDPRLAALGGPTLCPAEADSLSRLIHATMAHPFAFGSSSARYRAKGRLRWTSEKELILCNLLIRKEVFLQHDGFDLRLYPNEENALLDRFQRAGYSLAYDPEFTVRRFPRATLFDYIRMLFRYGRGRGEQVRVQPTWNCLENLAPVLLIAGLVTLLMLPPPISWLAGAYPLGAAVGALASRKPKPTLFPMIMLTHAAYALGLVSGLLLPVRASRPYAEPEVVRAKTWTD